MEWIAPLAQVIIALGIVNVWVVRYGRPTPYRPGDAGNMEEEFARYGLPGWMRTAVGGAKLGLAALLLLGIVVTPVSAPAAAAMAVLMVGAILAHVRVRDPWMKSVPAFVMLLLSTVVIYSA